MSVSQCEAIFIKLGLKKPRTKSAGMMIVERPRILSAVSCTWLYSSTRLEMRTLSGSTSSIGAMLIVRVASSPV